MSFSKQVELATEKYKKRYPAVFRSAVQRLVTDAQRPRAQGGRMRVKTGFLRASIQAALGTMPSGPTTNPGKTVYQEGQRAAGEPLSVTLLRWKHDEPLFIGWTANYARAREYRDGFRRGAEERWEEFVRRAANEAERGGL